MEINEIMNALQRVECMARRFDEIAGAKTTISRPGDYWRMVVVYGEAGNAYRYEFDSLSELRNHLNGMTAGAMIAKEMEV